MRNDARQEQVDQAQSGGDQRQDLLYSQQEALERPAAGKPLTTAQSQVELQIRTRVTMQRAADEEGRKPGGSWRVVPLVTPLRTMLRRAWIAQGRPKATWLDHAGVSPKVASQLMGHKTPEYQPGAASITLRRYTHTLPGELERSCDQLDRFLVERTRARRAQ